MKKIMEEENNLPSVEYLKGLDLQKKNVESSFPKSNAYFDSFNENKDAIKQYIEHSKKIYSVSSMDGLYKSLDLPFLSHTIVDLKKKMGEDYFKFLKLFITEAMSIPLETGKKKLQHNLNKIFTIMFQPSISLSSLSSFLLEMRVKEGLELEALPIQTLLQNDQGDGNTINLVTEVGAVVFKIVRDLKNGKESFELGLGHPISTTNGYDNKGKLRWKGEDPYIVWEYPLNEVTTWTVYI